MRNAPFNGSDQTAMLQYKTGEGADRYDRLGEISLKVVEDGAGIEVTIKETETHSYLTDGAMIHWFPLAANLAQTQNLQLRMGGKWREIVSLKKFPVNLKLPEAKLKEAHVCRYFGIDKYPHGGIFVLMDHPQPTGKRKRVSVTDTTHREHSVLTRPPLFWSRVVKITEQGLQVCEASEADHTLIMSPTAVDAGAGAEGRKGGAAPVQSGVGPQRVSTGKPVGTGFHNELCEICEARFGIQAEARRRWCSVCSTAYPSAVYLRRTGAPNKPRRSSEKDAKLAQKLGQRQPFRAAFPQECMGQLASFEPT